ncbi:hypothetical protein T310_9859, partial [Rasamsonia emersonii CBS 393.64]
YSMCLTTIFQRSLFAHVNDYRTDLKISYSARPLCTALLTAFQGKSSVRPQQKSGLCPVPAHLLTQVRAAKSRKDNPKASAILRPAWPSTVSCAQTGPRTTDPGPEGPSVHCTRQKEGGVRIHM